MGSRSVEVKQQEHDQHCSSMLHNLMVVLQKYLLRNGGDKQCGALTSVELVGSTAQLRADNRICIWLADVWHER